MERVTRRLEVATRALASLFELSDLSSPSAVERDAAIQRFEHSVETCWKAAQAVLSEAFGVELASPKAAVRASAQSQLLSEPDARAAMKMIDDRNLTTHTYNEALATAIYLRLTEHARLLDRWLRGLSRGAL